MTKARDLATSGPSTGLVGIKPASAAVGSGSYTLTDTGVTFSGASSVSLNDVFSATYKNYRILLNHSNSSGAVTTRLRLRNAGSDAATNYYYSGISTSSNSATISSYRGNNLTFAELGDGDGASSYACIIDIFSPFESSYTRFSDHFIGRINEYKSFLVQGGHDVIGSYSGFTIYVASGTITGSITVMGYNA